MRPVIAASIAFVSSGAIVALGASDMPPSIVCSMSSGSTAVRRALVTGASRGLGLAVARALARDGLDVVGTYAHDEAAARAAREHAEAEQLAISLARCDAGSAAEVADLFERIAPVDVLVHAAGFTRDRLLLTMSDGDFDDLIAVHLRAGFLASRHALPAMLARQWGRIVYLISPTALTGRRGQTN